MKKTIYSLVFFSMALFIATSCGPSKKFTASVARGDRLQAENSNVLDQLMACNNKNNVLSQEKVVLQNENEQVKRDLSSFTATSKLTIADQATRLRTLENMIQAQKDVTNNLKNSISKALMNYTADELSVYTKDGNVYVSLAEKLLFKSGSDVVDPKGKAALKTLAEVLNTTKDITVLIEGHTDNVPIKTNKYKDNWDLSTARANSIVRILTVDNGFDSKRITASGKGIFHPVMDNTTADGRTANRRTEVILSPDLNELYKLLYQ
jgi:chemotaxis protein MotB